MDFLKLFSSNDQSDQGDLDQTSLDLFVLMLSSSWRVDKLVVERNPEILSMKIIRLLDQISLALEKIGSGNPRISEISRLLRECQKRGVDKTFEPYDQPQNGFNRFLELIYPERKKGAPEYLPLELEPILALDGYYGQLYESFEHLTGISTHTKKLILNNRIQLFENVISHTEFDQVGEKEKLFIFDDFAGRLMDMYHLTQDEVYFQAFVRKKEQMIGLIPRESHSAALNLDQLSVNLREHYYITRDLNEIKKSIHYSRLAVKTSMIVNQEARISNSEDYLNFKNNLASSLGENFRVSDDISDLDSALNEWRYCIKYASSNHPNYYLFINNFTLALELHYQNMHNLDILREAIDMLRLLILNMDLPDEVFFEKNLKLAEYLSILYDIDGELILLDEAIKILNEYLQVNAQAKSTVYNLLGNCQLEYSRSTGDFVFLEKSIQSFQLAVSHSTDNELNIYYLGLGNSLISYYDSTQEVKVLQESVWAYRKAIEFTKIGDLNYPHYLNNLGNGLNELYLVSGQKDYLTETMNLYQNALDLVSDDDNLSRARFLHNLSLARYDFFTLNKNLQDIIEVIELERNSISITPKTAPEYISRLGGLSEYLLEKYLLSNNMDDLDESIDLLEKMVEGSMPKSMDYLEAVARMGRRIYVRFDATKNQDDLNVAVEYFRRTCSEGISIYPRIVFDTGSNWGIRAFRRKSWEEAIEAFDYASVAFERLFEFQFSAISKTELIQRNSNNHQYLAYSLAKCGNVGRAVEVIEQGRARLLSDKLQTAIREIERLPGLGYEELFRDFKKTQQKIDGLSRERYQKMESLKAESNQSVDLIQIQKILQDLIKKIRKIPGYERMFLPATIQEIQEMAVKRPLVYLIHRECGCLALIVTEKNVEEIWLDEFDLEQQFGLGFGITTGEWNELRISDGWKTGDLSEIDLQKLQNGYFLSSRKWHYSSNLNDDRDEWEKTLDKTIHVLGELIVAPIIEYLSSRQYKEIVFIPTGYLSLLPFHIAIIPNSANSSGISYALDRITFTFTPNARTIQQASLIASHVVPTNLLAVDNPDGSLTFSHAEVSTVLPCFVESLHLQGPNATRQAILSSFEKYSVVHISSHGKADPENPLKSSILTANGQITLDDIYNLRLPGVRLAFLSACETAALGDDLLDEVVSLPSGLLQAGFAGVIGTLWPVSEIATAMLVSRFYDLWRNENIDPAESLRLAQIWMRDTSNGEKKEYFRKIKQKDLLTYFSLLDEGDYSFSDPFFWAAFTYHGV